MKKILVTGGAGYIGSHAVVELFAQGFEPVILDNFSNSKPVVIDRLTQLCGQRPAVIEADLRESEAINQVFEQQEFDAVIHFAGLKAVAESVETPLRYYQNNVCGALNLFKAMQQAGCTNLVFSSSATVYGDAESVPTPETAALSAINPYGQTKLMIEHILRDLAQSDDRWHVALLRYFNPVAAHPSGLIGEDPNGPPNNLVPYVAQVAVGRRDSVAVFGNDYNTPDGTGVRDYIHVVDLARAHLSALQALPGVQGCAAYNVGTGNGYSVLDVIEAFRQASGAEVPYHITARRAGDVATSFADVQRSARELNWRAQYDLTQMMQDHWRWQSENPNGYDD